MGHVSITWITYALIQIVVSVKRIRREFGAACKFADRNADKTKDGIIDCPAYEEKSFDLKRMELERGIQVFGKICNESCLYCSDSFLSC